MEEVHDRRKPVVELRRGKSVGVDRILRRVQRPVRQRLGRRVDVRRIHRMDELDARHDEQALALELRVVALEEVVGVRVRARIVRRRDQALVPSARIGEDVLPAVAHHRRVAVALPVALAAELGQLPVHVGAAGVRRCLHRVVLAALAADGGPAVAVEEGAFHVGAPVPESVLFLAHGRHSFLRFLFPPALSPHCPFFRPAGMVHCACRLGRTAPLPLASTLFSFFRRKSLTVQNLCTIMATTKEKYIFRELTGA